MWESEKRKRSTLTFGVIIAIAIIAAVALIVISGNNRSDTATTALSDIPNSRTSDGGFVLGESNAPVTIVEFADYACPHCQEYRDTIDRFINDYVKSGKAKFEYRIFPTAGGNTTAFFGTLAVCIERQKKGAFWQASELFYQKAEQGDYGENTGREVASEIGVDYNTALACTQGENQVNTDVEVGRSLGVTGTPAVAIRYHDGALAWITYNGQTYDRGGVPLDVLGKVVESAQ